MTSPPSPDPETISSSPVPGGRAFAWPRPLVEAIRITIVGGCIAITLGVLRGTPDIVALRADDPASCAAPVAQRPDVQWIEQGEARDLIADTGVTFVDARAPGVYETGHVAGALNVSMETGAIDDRATSLVRGSRMVIAYCDTTGDCASSKRLAGLLAEAGLPDVRVLRGGMPEWLANDYPAEAGPCRVCP